VLIGGFIVTGPQSEMLVVRAVRAVGPSLAANGVSGAFSNPTLDIYNSNGDLLCSNDNYTTSVNIITIGQFGLVPLKRSRVGHLLRRRARQLHRFMRGVGGAAGVGLIEVYGVN
jgi:hypothetical protein